MDLTGQKVTCSFILLPEEDLGVGILAPSVIPRQVLPASSLASIEPNLKLTLTSLMSRDKSQEALISGWFHQGYCCLTDLPVLILFLKSLRIAYYVTHPGAIYTFSPTLHKPKFCSDFKVHNLKGYLVFAFMAIMVIHFFCCCCQ